MREGRRETKICAWTLVGIFAVFGLVADVILVATAFLAGKMCSDLNALSTAGLISVVTNAILVTSVCVTVAIYRRTVGSDVREAATFR